MTELLEWRQEFAATLVRSRPQAQDVDDKLAKLLALGQERVALAFEL
jgi:hypothetical protein